ncbi:MAG: hypothetical protein E7611_00360 [Ruminococcaceae bacterium]|nr:hypothetical protein [Oscillospiraceae bacterium]
MTNMKKIALILSVCLLLIALVSITACTGSDKKPDTDKSPETKTEDNETMPEEPETGGTGACLSHKEEIVAGKAPSCTEDGLTEGKICSVCKTVIVEQEAIAKLYHTEVIIESISATCTEAGYTSGKKCAVCDEIIIAPVEIPALDHLESDWIIDKTSEVGADGLRHTECVRCSEIITTENFPAITEGHVHEGKEWAVVSPATCTAEGIKVLRCDCGVEIERASIEKTEHIEEITIGIAPTCMTTGLTDGKKCSVCQKILVAQQTIASKAHTEITMLGRAATCTETGSTDGKKCAFCSQITLAQLSVPPTGHSFADGACTACALAETYGVWIVDGLGNPISDVIVKILKGDELVKMYPYNGQYLPFELEDGEYRIELDLSQTGRDFVYDADSCVMSPEKRSVKIELRNKLSEPTSIFVGYPILADYQAYNVTSGSYELTLTPNDYTFIIFRPSASAVYTLTYVCDSELTVSYHGSSFFVQGEDLSGSSEAIAKYKNGLSVDVFPGNIGGDLVFAIKSESATSCILNIANAGDPGTRLEDEPWSPYLEDDATVSAQLSAPKEGTYTEIDLTDTSLKAVFNEKDGYYHLNSEDGPIIFIDLTTDSKYISSIQVICANQRMGTYIYDINGDVVEKRSYNELFHQYGMPSTKEEKVEQAIRVPLTEKLAEAIKTFGDKNSWWAEGSDANIFTKLLLGTPYNREYAWLLFCGYYAD